MYKFTSAPIQKLLDTTESIEFDGEVAVSTGSG